MSETSTVSVAAKAKSILGELIALEKDIIEQSRLEEIQRKMDAAKNRDAYFEEIAPVLLELRSKYISFSRLGTPAAAEALNQITEVSGEIFADAVGRKFFEDDDPLTVEGVICHCCNREFLTGTVQKVHTPEGALLVFEKLVGFKADPSLRMAIFPITEEEYRRRFNRLREVREARKARKEGRAHNVALANESMPQLLKATTRNGFTFCAVAFGGFPGLVVKTLREQISQEFNERVEAREAFEARKRELSRQASVELGDLIIERKPGLAYTTGYYCQRQGAEEQGQVFAVLFSYDGCDLFVADVAAYRPGIESDVLSCFKGKKYPSMDESVADRLKVLPYHLKHFIVNQLEERAQEFGNGAAVAPEGAAMFYPETRRGERRAQENGDSRRRGRERERGGGNARRYE